MIPAAKEEEFVHVENEKDLPHIASRIYPDATPPTQAQIDIIRFTWERISEIHLPTDDQNVSPTHAFGLAFYDALFQLEPSLKPLFSDIFLQARALAGMVAYIARTPKVTGSKCPFSGKKSRDMQKELTIREINALKKREYAADDFQALISSVSQSHPNLDDNDISGLLFKLRELGARHYFYDVKPEHLALVGPAVLHALKSRLGNEFLPEVAEAWTRAHAYAGYHMTIGLEAQQSWENGQKKAAHKKMGFSSNTKSNCTIQ